MRFALACRLVLAVCLAIPNVWVHVVVGDDGGVETMDPEEMEALAEYMRELEAEEAAQQAEEADAEHDASRAASAEAAAKLAENKAAQEEAAAAAAEAARASQRSKSTFYRATAGAGAMKDRLSSRESVETSGSGGRSRVPRSSQPGNANSNGSGMGFGGAGGSASGSDAPSFASLNEQMRSGGPGGGASRAGHGDGAGRAGGGEEAEEEVEPESRRAARAALDEPTRAAHRRAVASVLRAAGDGSSMLGDAGGGDWYKVLGLRRSVKGRAKVKQEYRQRALTVHPDKNLDADAPAAFALLQEAYAVLSDDAKRAHYDRQLLKRAKVRRARHMRRLSETWQSFQGLLQYGVKRIGVGEQLKRLGSAGMPSLPSPAFMKFAFLLLVICF